MVRTKFHWFSNKKLLATKGIATRSKDATNVAPTSNKKPSPPVGKQWSYSEAAVSTQFSDHRRACLSQILAMLFGENQGSAPAGTSPPCRLSSQEAGHQRPANRRVSVSNAQICMRIVVVLRVKAHGRYE